MHKPRALAFILKEFRELLPPTLFFAAGFCMIEFTIQLVLDAYQLRFANYVLAIVGALVVGKAVLLADLLPFLRRFDTAPLAVPILFKTFVYAAAVLLVRILEQLVEYASGGGSLAGLPDYFASHFLWHRIIATQLWIVVLFLAYVFATELDTSLGEGGLPALLFTRRRSRRASGEAMAAAPRNGGLAAAVAEDGRGHAR